MLYKSTGISRKKISEVRGALVKTSKMNKQSDRVNHNDTSLLAGGIGRREAVQRLLTGAGGALIVPALRAEPTVHKHLADVAVVGSADASAVATDWTPEFLDAHQNESLIALAERIIPGSGQAQVDRLIDLLLTVDTPANQKQFLVSLGAFDGESGPI